MYETLLRPHKVQQLPPPRPLSQVVDKLKRKDSQVMETTIEKGYGYGGSEWEWGQGRGRGRDGQESERGRRVEV
ncbi:hypothetical protein J3R82DRAFT_9281 [Butyriboletus roseoflavus]|nr:hypothetical protein J3R82DRAFT_9281 [Butyriboletus roseoflavus]